jgi:hypothetical protein
MGGADRGQSQANREPDHAAKPATYCPVRKDHPRPSSAGRAYSRKSEVAELAALDFLYAALEIVDRGRTVQVFGFDLLARLTLQRISDASEGPGKAVLAHHSSPLFAANMMLRRSNLQACKCTAAMQFAYGGPNSSRD